MLKDAFFGVTLGILIQQNASRKNTQKHKELVNALDYRIIKFPVSKQNFSKTEMKNNLRINMFCHENKPIFPIYISDQKGENSMDLLLIINENKSHYVYIKYFDRFMFCKAKNKNKKYFCKTRLRCFYCKNVLAKHKEVLALMVHNL